MRVVDKFNLIFMVTLIHVIVTKSTIPLLQTGIDFVENGFSFIRQGIEWWNEDPVAFAHRVYGSTVSVISKFYTRIDSNRYNRELKS